jgi:hypothetical protein
MKWLEIIELRSVDYYQEQLKPLIQILINEVKKEVKDQAISAYNRIMVDTDFTLHLLHDSNNVEYCGSPLGLRLSLALKDYGSVNHSVWAELKSN